LVKGGGGKSQDFYPLPSEPFDYRDERSYADNPAAAVIAVGAKTTLRQPVFAMPIT